ncbi:MAG: flagellar filament capping protein FliD [Thiomicrospira sp.]|uniref:flagellar filament capping protein FliD n=1 Tax=Thiomicrospira sp. TaxID=935 RepID=UPI001A0DDC32|nr:flagellar filament capping protein FliD [Thiomicrospira sp.]MBE0494471.1 flagellar filament capping protein FliD [Thiomicrospira sp.]
MANEIGSTLLNSLTKSSFDVGNMAKVLAEADVAGPLNIVERKSEKYNTELNALKYLQANLTAFNTYAKDLASPDLFTKNNVSSSNEAVVSASITGSATAGSYNIESMQLAQAHTVISGKTFGSQYDAISNGTMTINGQDITIDDSNNTLEGLQRTINASGLGVTASIINNGGQYQLMMSANQTGAASQFTVTGHPDFAGADEFAAVPGAEGQDAIMKLNGVQVSNSTNSFSDVVNGVTFNLNSQAVGTTQVVSIASDTESAVTAIKDFVLVYNQLDTILKELGSYKPLTAAEMEDPEKEFTGDLAGNSLLRDLRTQIRESMRGELAGATGSFDSLSSVGISFDRYGQMQLDEAQLNSVINSDMGSIATLFSAGGTATDNFVDVTGSSARTLEGSYALNITQVAERATVAGDTAVAAGGVDLSAMTAAERTFSIGVDGGAVVDITLAAQNYASPQEFAAAMAAAINGNADIMASGARVSVSLDAASNLNITSNRFGSTSGVDISAFAPAGFSAAATDIGQNVDGTLTMSNGATVNIGAYADMNDGRKVNISDFAVDSSGAAADIRGLKFEVQGGAIGPRGTIDFTEGFGSKMFNTINNVLEADTGLIGQRVNSLNDRLGELEERREKIDVRFEKMEMKYRMQFSMMQSIMSQMQETQSFLTQTYNRPQQ